MTHAKVSRKDPYGNFNFRVTLMHSRLGYINCGFHTVSGLGITVNYKEYREGGNNYIPDKLVDFVTDNPVMFSNGLTDNEAITDLASFFLSPTGGNRVVGAFQNRFDILVEVMNRTNDRVAKSFMLQECVLETFLLGDLNSLGTEFAIESFSVRFNGLTKS